MRGVLLFAFNNPKFNYYEMAVATAKRANHFLGLPVTIVTDSASLPEKQTYTFDKVVVVESDKTNRRDRSIWINKGRHQAYALSPYDETLLLDTDYMINSPMLLKTLGIYDDFCCHDTTSFLMQPGIPQELFSTYSPRTLWATVIAFRKTKRAQQIFECMEMVQKNYDHYTKIHNFIGGVLRNDYALTLALSIVNGHSNDPHDFIPWNLLHIGQNTSIFRNSDTEYTVMFDAWKKGKIRKEYILIRDTDFHCMDKKNFMELI